MSGYEGGVIPKRLDAHVLHGCPCSPLDPGPVSTSQKHRADRHPHHGGDQGKSPGSSGTSSKVRGSAQGVHKDLKHGREARAGARAPD